MDFHNTYGVNTVDLSAINTLNPSQVIVNKVTQTTFNAGAYRFSQNTTGLNFTRSYGNILSGLNVAFGTEFRTDAYKIVAGEESSWKRYGTDVSLAGGAQNFPGVRPDNATNQSRTNLGVYTDFELSLTNKWLVAAALRYENYSDFGSTLNEKVASRYKVTDKFFVRGSFSTGFRAPSLAQRYFGATINDVVVDAEEGSGGYEERLIATNNSSITKALGIPSLKQETSFNSSIGFVVKPSKNLSISVDAYQVNVKDRIILTGEFYASDPIIKAAFDNLGVIGVQFFANALDTKTVGLDITANLITPLTKGTLTSSFGININDLSIQQIKTTPALAGRDSSFLTTRDKLLLVYSAPKYKFHALFDYKYERLMANVRFSGFSAVDVIDYDSQHPNTPNHYDAKIVTDLSLGYKLNQHTSILVGGNNLFNVYPNKQIPSQTETGGMYEAIQMGFGGSFYSIRAKLNF
jgi:iron complex outermembrane receptor protein